MHGVEGVGYNFSLCRIVLYVVFLLLLCIFRKYFLKGVFIEKSSRSANASSKKNAKGLIIVIYTIIAIIGIGITTVYLFTTDIALPKVAIINITLILGEICLIYLSNDLVKDIIVLTITLALPMIATVDVNNRLDEGRHFATAYNVAMRKF